MVNVAQTLSGLLAHLGIQRAEGLVQQQHPQLDRKRAGQRHTQQSLGNIGTRLVQRSGPQADTRKNGGPGTTRTPNPRIRSSVLYPVELRGHWRLHATSRMLMQGTG